MNDKNDNIGCGKLLLIAAAVILVLVIIVGAIEGIGDLFSEIPWYGHVILSIGFIYIIFKFYD